MRKINKIIVHCSASDWGNAAEIDKWHKERGWSGIGYHYVINNCYPSYEAYRQRRPVVENDSLLEKGRNIEKVGAHCEGYNTGSVGVCLIGADVFTGGQIAMLKSLVHRLRKDYGPLPVFPHNKFSTSKSCPNLDLEFLEIT